MLAASALLVADLAPSPTTTTTKPQLNLFLWLYFSFQKTTFKYEQGPLRRVYAQQMWIFLPLFIHFQVNVAAQARVASIWRGMANTWRDHQSDFPRAARLMFTGLFLRGDVSFSSVQLKNRLQPFKQQQVDQVSFTFHGENR